MPNIGTALKAEITRLARKELRAETTALKKSAAAHRAELATLKKRCMALEKALKALCRGGGRLAVTSSAGADGDADAEQGRLRFRAQGLASHRKRLGLTVEQAGQLIGVSGQSVYLWESGRARPRAKFLAAIDALRKMGKREAAARLANGSAAE